MKLIWPCVRAAFFASPLLGAVLALSCVRHVGAAEPAAEPGAPASAAEAAIRASARAFVAAFNAGNAKAIGAMWAPDATYTDESGQTLQGREAIEKEYAAAFQQHLGAMMSVQIESIRFLSPDVAIEKGVARVKSPGGLADTTARYTVKHAWRDGKWIMASGRDAPYVPVANEDYLKDLEWLIGDWAPEDKALPLRMRFEWMGQRNFIKNTHTVIKEGQATLTGGQIIGWNPKLGCIASWHFDAQGGFGEDVWTKDGSKWVITAKGTMRDGSESTAVNIATPLGANSFLWQSIKRTLEGAPLPDVPPVKLVRAPSSKP